MSLLNGLVSAFHKKKLQKAVLLVSARQAIFCLPKKTPILFNFPSAGEQCEEVHVVVKALKGLLEKKQKKAKELTQEQYLREFRASKEVQILKKLEEEVYQLEALLHCEMEAISGHH